MRLRKNNETESRGGAGGYDSLSQRGCVAWKIAKIDVNLVGEFYGAWQELRLHTERGSGGFHGRRRSLDEVVAIRTLHDGRGMSAVRVAACLRSDGESRSKERADDGVHTHSWA